MTRPSKTQYLDSKVLTASQPQLHLMLLNGALRFGRQTQKAWGSNAEAASDEPMTRMIEIVEALVNGAAAGTEESSQPMSEQYAFVYRELVASQLNHDLEKLIKSLELLEYQRETWNLACDKLVAETAAASKSPALSGMHVPMSSTGSLSLEA